MRPALTRSIPVFGVLLLLLAACGSDGASRDEVLIGITDGVAVPAYEALARDAAQMERDAAALCGAPSAASLEAARQSWRAARASWMQSEAVQFGPVMDRRSVRLVDWSPTDADGIDEMLAGGPVPIGDIREVIGSDLRGFGAVEYLLFVEGALDRLTGSEARCSYLTGLTEVIRDETEGILAEWVDGTASRAAYKDYFTGRSDSAALSSAAVADVVRTQVFLIRGIVDMQLANALGLRGEPDFSMIPGTAADHGLHDIRSNLLGMRAVYEGVDDGLGLSGLVRPLSEETDGSMREHFADSLAAVDAIDGPLKVALVERTDQVRGLYDQLASLQRTLSTEVVSLLGVSVGFTDTDGDSSS